MYCHRLFFALTAFVISLANIDVAGAADPNTILSKWQRGISVDSVERSDMRVYLWFYEWQLFDAIERGQMTNGIWNGRPISGGREANKVHQLPIGLDNNRISGSVDAGERGLRIDMTAVDDGAELTLSITNRSDHDWPTLAAVIPCFNPGPEESRNSQFANTKTFFKSATGLEPLAQRTPREMHYNSNLKTLVDREADQKGRYVWTNKWPKSDVDSVEGLIIREATDGKWVTGIAWERFVTVQGHNPWECMHLSVNVGPLKVGESRSVRGKIYLFKGTKEELLTRYRQDFSTPDAR